MPQQMTRDAEILLLSAITMMREARPRWRRRARGRDAEMTRRLISHTFGVFRQRVFCFHHQRLLPAVFFFRCLL